MGTKHQQTPANDENTPGSECNTKTQDCSSIFTSPTVTVIVGVEKTAFTAHLDILTPVNFFAVGLDPYCFSDGQSRSMTLPEQKPAVFHQILHFLYRDDLDWNSLPAIGTTAGRHEDMTLFLDLYISADTFQLEKLCNNVVDAMIHVYSFIWVPLCSIDYLRRKGLPDCRLRWHLIERLAFDLRSCGWEEQVGEGIAKYPESALDLIKELAQPPQDIETYCVPNCNWHTHNVSEFYEACDELDPTPI